MARANSADGASSPDVGTQLKRIANLLALDAIEGDGQQEQIDLLHRVGYSNDDAAMLLGTTPDTVRVTVNKINKERAEARGRRPAKKSAAKKTAAKKGTSRAKRSGK